MSLRVKVNGANSFEIAKDCVQKVKFRTDIPLDSNARTKDVGSTLEITGKILVSTDGDPFDSTRQLALWSVVPAEEAAAYRQVEVEIINAGITERKYSFPRAFVIDYKEDFSNSDGIGQFTIVIKQKKDKLDTIAIEGGYISA
ncbi:MAG: membrane-associated protease 1 [Lachnospiraceae bacterium]|nr:membrane-associated protease 1 [Lachnospiraceae bacterium]MDE7202028.1 membrane-associated protease 1 [Lachnospiraceae bacterium]MDE7417477.1 membrane-associated protease 1 [Lachnospiraceae bacterium]